MNKKRKAIYDKSRGHCFYCGVKLGEKGWHADHFHPVLRVNDYQIKDGVMIGKDTGQRVYPELDCDENLVPSCAPCNNFKSVYDIEAFRQHVANQFETVRKASTGFRMLERMSMIEFDESAPVTFWFERNGIKMKSKAAYFGLNEDAENVDWQYENDSGYFCQVGGRTVALHSEDRKWHAIATDSNWNQLRYEIECKCLIDAKLRAASWALNGFEEMRG